MIFPFLFFFFQGTIGKADEKVIRGIADRIAESGAIPTLLRFAEGSRGVVEVLKSCWALRELCFSSSIAAYEVIRLGGIPILGRLFAPGHFEKELAAARDRGFDVHSHVLLSQGVDDMLSQANALEMTDEECYRRALVRCTAMQENAGATIAYLLLHCKEARRCLLGDECAAALKATLKWIQQPAVMDTDQGNTLSGVMVLKQVFSSSAATVMELFTKHRVLAVSGYHSDSLTPYETFSKKLLWPTVLTSWQLS